MHKYLGMLFCVLLGPQFAMAQDADFSACILELQDRARSENLSAWVVDDVLGNLQQQHRVIELDRSQPEFTRTFADYFYRRVTPERIERGQMLLNKYDGFLAELTKKYGIPGRYLVAFWGLETNFGSYLGKMPTLDSLATLACDQRRSEFFTGELMQALALLERESLAPADMQGSWAGAMGHTQFMPSAYNRYAVDGDGDGRVNLWRSEQDALASGANFLASLGWQKGERWGREVRLPDDFPYAETGLNNSQPLKYWRNLGVSFTNGARLPDADIQASLLVPAGHAGPAFLVYPNFKVILRWNRSEYYALSVGLLADRLTGAGPLMQPPSTTEAALSRDTVEQMQRKLNRLGFDAGEIDGVMGSLTQAALREFQASAGMIADGYPDRTTLCALLENKGSMSCL
ncbi:MAG: lytic murein transglycosylase [Gammaproteobacteria bacterium]|jgi:membrane-bound lytic murein transglycosylase B